MMSNQKRKGRNFMNNWVKGLIGAALIIAPAMHAAAHEGFDPWRTFRDTYEADESAEEGLLDIFKRAPTDGVISGDKGTAGPSAGEPPVQKKKPGLSSRQARNKERPSLSIGDDGSVEVKVWRPKSPDVKDMDLS
jgi:hypothetical protein